MDVDRQVNFGTPPDSPDKADADDAAADVEDDDPPVWKETLYTIMMSTWVWSTFACVTFSAGVVTPMDARNRPMF